MFENELMKIGNERVARLNPSATKRREPEGPPAAVDRFSAFARGSFRSLKVATVVAAGALFPSAAFSEDNHAAPRTLGGQRLLPMTRAVELPAIIAAELVVLMLLLNRSDLEEEESEEEKRQL